MRVVVNGESREFENDVTLDEVVADLGVPVEGAGVAVALNDEVIPKARWRETPVTEGDRLEVIHAVQGG